MPEARSAGHARTRVVGAALGALLLITVLAPGLAFGRGAGDLAASEIHLAAVPGDERCADQSPNPDTGQKLCDTPILSVGNILPIFGVVVAAGLLALVVAYLVLRRRASAPLAPADPGEWWACPKCGSTNVVGSARCYSCGTWQR